LDFRKITAEQASKLRDPDYRGVVERRRVEVTRYNCETCGYKYEAGSLELLPPACPVCRCRTVDAVCFHWIECVAPAPVERIKLDITREQLASSGPGDRENPYYYDETGYTGPGWLRGGK
jgi:hypothetical protein